MQKFVAVEADTVFDRKLGALVHYLSELFVMICHGGRLLCGRSDIRRAYQETKLIFLNKENENKNEINIIKFNCLNTHHWLNSLLVCIDNILFRPLIRNP